MNQKHLDGSENNNHMPNIMNNWPEWAWVSRHAERPQNDTLVLTGPGNGHIFPQSERPSYCSRYWGPQEYIQWRIEILTQEAEDLEKLIRLFGASELRHNKVPLIAQALCDSQPTTQRIVT